VPIAETITFSLSSANKLWLSTLHYIASCEDVLGENYSRQCS